MAHPLLTLSSDSYREFHEAQKGIAEHDGHQLPMIALTLTEMLGDKHCYGMSPNEAKRMAKAVLRILAADGDEQASQAMNAMGLSFKS